MNEVRGRKPTAKTETFEDLRQQSRHVGPTAHLSGVVVRADDQSRGVRADELPALGRPLTELVAGRRLAEAEDQDVQQKPIVERTGSMLMKNRVAAVVCAVGIGATAAGAASNPFTSTWKSPSAGPMNYVGRKVAALVIVDDDSLRMSAEEALAREISARGPTGLAAYRLIPREELTDKDRAKAWFGRASVEGMVVMRVVGVDTQKVYSSVVWSSGYYGNAWDYYGYGWATAYPIGKAHTETTIAVETLLYNVADAKPIWAGVSQTTNPKNVASFMKGLAGDVVKELQKQGLARKGLR
jgi:hypothetical protein